MGTWVPTLAVFSFVGTWVPSLAVVLPSRPFGTCSIVARRLCHCGLLSEPQVNLHAHSLAGSSAICLVFVASCDRVSGTPLFRAPSTRCWVLSLALLLLVVRWRHRPSRAAPPHTLPRASVRRLLWSSLFTTLVTLAVCRSSSTTLRADSPLTRTSTLLWADCWCSSTALIFFARFAWRSLTPCHQPSPGRPHHQRASLRLVRLFLRTESLPCLCLRDTATAWSTGVSNTTV